MGGALPYIKIHHAKKVRRVHLNIFNLIKIMLSGLCFYEHIVYA